MVREVYEETGLHAEVGDPPRVYSAHLPGVWREGQRVDAHALRIVYDGWVPLDSPEPRVVEVDGSTAEAAWQPVADVLDGGVPAAPLVLEALADHLPYRKQRVAAYALIVRGDRVLLTRISERGYHPGSWTLPGGGIDHGESPRAALEREVQEECGVPCEVGGLLDVHDVHFDGTAPPAAMRTSTPSTCCSRRPCPTDVEPRVVEVGGTTDAVAWVPLAEIEAGEVPVLDVVRHALEMKHAVGAEPDRSIPGATPVRASVGTVILGPTGSPSPARRCRCPRPCSPTPRPR